MYQAVEAEPALTAPLGGVERELAGVPPSFDEKAGQCGTTVAVVRWRASATAAPALIDELSERLRRDGWVERRAGFGAVELSKDLAGEDVTLLVTYDPGPGAVEARSKRTAAG